MNATAADFIDELERRFEERIDQSETELKALKQSQIEQYKDLLDPQLSGERRRLMQQFSEHLQQVLFDNYEEISSRLDSAFAWSTESIQWNHENQKELAELLPRMVEQISQYTASPNAGLLNTDYTAANEQMDSLIMKISHLHRQLKNVQSKQ